MAWRRWLSSPHGVGLVAAASEAGSHAALVIVEARAVSSPHCLPHASLTTPSRLVFISHSHSDGTEPAERLDRELRAHGIDTWRTARDIDVSSDFTGELEAAIEASAVLVACITAGVRRRDSYVRREIAYAQMHHKRIAVARFAPVPPPISVVTYTYFEFHRNWCSAFARLLAFAFPGQYPSRVTRTLSSARHYHASCSPGQ
jgi:hypothetical protein